MEASSFWLISIDDFQATVSLLSWNNGHHTVSSIGPSKAWLNNNSDSLNLAVDESLSAAATDSGLNEDEEPIFSAFVLPPFWVGQDGKIVSTKLKLIENLCKSLNFKPIGFISSDEAIVEESNQSDGFPSSFVLLNLTQADFTLSLVYLGHIKERIKKSFENGFDPKLIESTLLELKSDSTLPPQIIIFGEVSKDQLLAIKNYPWVGKKDIETFLHFPDVKYYQPEDVITIFAKTILNQINPQPLETSKDTKKEIKDELETIVTDEENMADDVPQDEVLETEETSEDEPEITPLDDIKITSEYDLEEVDSDSLGFKSAQNLPIITPDQLPQFNLETPPVKVGFTSEPEVKSQLKPKFSFSFLKKIHLLKFPKVKKNKIGLIPLVLIPLLIFIPLYFSKAKVTLFVTPYTFNKQINATLDSTASDFDASKTLIPVVKKTIDVDTQVSVKTTGKKTIGNKAQGEVVIYNILTKGQNLSKGTKLTDESGKIFELINPVAVAASNFDLEAGILKPGQTKANIQAADIGEEYNLQKDIKLQFKEFSESSIIAKIDSPLSGGSKQTINAVSEQDKKDLSQKISQSITDQVSDKISKELSGTNGLIKETIQSNQNKIDYSREVGEAADDLTATANATVTVFILNPETKDKIISQFLNSDPNFSQSDINPELFNFEYKVNKIDSAKAEVLLTIKGNALPKIDMSQLKKSLSGKSQSKATAFIKKNINSVYNFNFKTNFSSLKSFLPLPFRSQNITIDVQSEI